MRRPALRSAPEATSRHAGAATARHALLFVASLVTLGPLLWIVTLALRPQREFLNDPFGLPRRLYLDNFVTIFTNIGGPGPTPPDVELAWAATVLLGRMGVRQEIQGMALLLASDASSFMTGAVYPVDGGALSGWFQPTPA